MGACAETRHYSQGNDHRIKRVCVLRAFLAGGPALGVSGNETVPGFCKAGGGTYPNTRQSV